MKNKVTVSLDEELLKLVHKAIEENPTISRSSLINSALQFYFSEFTLERGHLVRKEFGK